MRQLIMRILYTYLFQRYVTRYLSHNELNEGVYNGRVLSSYNIKYT